MVENSDTGGASPAIVLVRPQMGENIGAAARAMLNFGLDHMRIVAPRDGWPNQKAVANASGAGRVLDSAMLTEDVPAALADLSHVYATTARVRELNKAVMAPAEAMADARARIAAGQRVGIMFGPERAGLENSDLVLAGTVVTVPVNPEFASLNLAQCVLLLAYEWRRQTAPEIPFDEMMAGPAATRQDVSSFLGALEGRLDAAGFFWPEGKRDSMLLNLRNLFGRLPLTAPEIRILHGIIKTLGRQDPRGRK